MSTQRPWFDRAQSTFCIVIVRALQVVLAIMILAAMVEIGVFLYQAIDRNFFDATAAANGAISTVRDLQHSVQRGFAAVLLVILGLELLETLRTYFVEHRIRVRIVIIVALIAVSRHIIQLDFEHVSGTLLIGIGVIVLALAGGYFLIARENGGLDVER